VTLTKCEALRMRTLLLPIFLYAPPLVCFTPAERDLLQAAVSGATDAEIARVMKISVSAVKARWSRTNSRFFTRFPESERRHNRSGSRGEQIRHVLLEYVRTHPSELTPY
jgi:hypothetical protein